MSGPGRALFYHLTRSGLDDTLLLILSRARDQGWTVALRGTDLARLEDLDRRLWLGGGADGFLPHGMAGGAHDDDQPILLGTHGLPAGAAGLLLIDGAETTAEEAAGLQRVWVLFDGNDERQLSGARALWTRLTTGGMAAQYWSEDSGKWAMKVEKQAAQ